MNRFMPPPVLPALCLALLLVACGDDDSNPPTGPTTITTYDAPQGWDCANGESCQDVFNIQFAAGSKVAFLVTNLTGSSIAQIALYAPGEPLGGINLFTNTTNEQRCNYVDGCDTMPDQGVLDLGFATTGVYRFAVTRDWGESCGASGTYLLHIESDKGFSTPIRSVNDVATLAPGTQCP